MNGLLRLPHRRPFYKMKPAWEGWGCSSGCIRTDTKHVCTQPPKRLRSFSAFLSLKGWGDIFQYKESLEGISPNSKMLTLKANSRHVLITSRTAVKAVLPKSVLEASSCQGRSFWGVSHGCEEAVLFLPCRLGDKAANGRPIITLASKSSLFLVRWQGKHTCVLWMYASHKSSLW